MIYSLILTKSKNVARAIAAAAQYMTIKRQV